MKKFSLIIIASLLLVLSACSGPKSEGTAGGTAEPKDLVFALGSEAVSLDPQDVSDAISYDATELIFDKLVTFDKDTKLVPQLAKEWSTSEDGKKLTFKLQQGAKFTDGTPLNAEAVKQSFERLLNKDNKLSRYSLYAEFVDKVVADSEYQVTFELKFPYAPALNNFAHPSGAIVSMKGVQEKGKNFNKSPVGSGPYQFKEWVSGDRLVLVPNNEYWGVKPKLKSITFKPIKENAARALMLETGEADVIVPVPATDIERLKGDNKLSITSSPSNRNLYIGMNTSRTPFKDVRVRQALNYAVDKETIVNKILLGQGQVSQAAISTLTWGFSPAGAYPYDPEKAKKLLAEAGVKPGTTIKLWTPDGRYLMDRQISEFVQGNLEAIGFKVEFRKWEWSAYSANFAARDSKSEYDLFLVSWAVPSNDADNGIRPLFQTKGSNNYAFLSDPTIDALIDKGMKTVNMDERKKIYVDLLKNIKEQAPWIFLVEMKQPLGVRKNVEGVNSLNTELVDLRLAVKK